MALTQKQKRRRARRLRFARACHDAITAPMAIFYLTYSNRVHPAYGMSWLKRMGLGFRYWRNFHKVTSGTSWRAHLVMAMKLLETSPEVVLRNQGHQANKNDTGRRHRQKKLMQYSQQEFPFNQSAKLID